MSDEVKRNLKKERAGLDPVRLLHELRETQMALAKREEKAQGRDGEASTTNLDEFLSTLPTLWREDEVRPTHKVKVAPERTWRTRADPFESVWPSILARLEATPDVAAKTLFGQLQDEHPEEFRSGQLRTLQRRVRDWRHAKARELVYANSDPIYENRCADHPTVDEINEDASRSSM